MNTLTYLAGKAPQPPPSDWVDVYLPKFYQPAAMISIPEEHADIFHIWRREQDHDLPEYLAPLQREYEAWKERNKIARLEATLKVQALWAFTWARAMLFQSTSTLDEMFEQAFPTT